MEYEDRLTISTPEGVDLSLELAGVGSRCAAALVDLAIQVTLVVAVILALDPLDEVIGSGFAVLAIVSVASFLVFFGYDITWEVWGGGSTPGKRILRLRVVRSGGAAIGFRASAVRNLLRLVDNLPGVYLLGLVCILATPRNQRLGDLAADAVVVYDRRDRGSRRRRAVHTDVVDDPAPAGAWDVSAVTVDDLATVRTFLQRRDDLEPDARRHLAADLAARLRPKVSSGSAAPDDEGFLTQLVEVKSARI